LPLSGWLRAIGYRPVTTGPLFALDGKAREQALSKVIRDIAVHIGRKAVLVTHSVGMVQALNAAQSHNEWISDVIVLDAMQRPRAERPHVHFIPTSWFALHNIIELSRILRGIGMELIEEANANPARTGVESST
jgi:pimeloyl-ACP methyl ester carboxylesterase